MNKPNIHYSKKLQHQLKQSQGPTRIQRYHSRLTSKIKQFSAKYKQRHQQRKEASARRRKVAQTELRIRAKKRARDKTKRAQQKKSGHNPKHRIDKTGATIACAVLAVILGGGAYYGVRSHNAQAHQDRIAQEQRANEVSMELKATPKAPIFQGNNQIGATDSTGNSRIQNVPIGSKLWTEYGKMKSNPIIVTKADKNKAITFTFNYLKGNQAQRYLTRYYQCVSNLVNHNDQNHKNANLANYYVNGSNSDAYKDTFKWGKAQYKTIQKNKKNSSDKGDTNKDKQVPFTALHFTIAMHDAVLNEDGSVTLNYGARYDFAGRVHDHVAVYNMSAIVKRVNGHWQLLAIHKPVTPKVSYND